MVLLALPFAFYATGKGLSFSAVEERLTSRFFEAQAVVASALIYLHMVSGGVITFLAPVQMSGVIRTRWPRLHHLIGYLVAGLAVLTAVAGLVYILQQGTIGGPVMSAGFALYGAMMLVVAVQTVRTARQRHVSHSLWAGRLILLALASWFYRVHYGLWELATGGLGSRSDFSGPFDLVQVFAFYLPYLILHHIWWHASQQHAQAPSTFKMR